MQTKPDALIEPQLLGMGVRQGSDYTIGKCHVYVREDRGFTLALRRVAGD